MIEFVKGTIDYVSPQYIVIENGGIGYQVFTPNPFIYKVSNQETIFTYHHIKEDAFSLYGFSTREEKALFTKLLNVTGIGPKGASPSSVPVTPEPSSKRLNRKMKPFW